MQRPTLESEEALVDFVRARLVQGHDRAQLPRHFALLYGIDEAVVVRALESVDDERRALERETRRELLRALGVGGAVGLLLWLVLSLWGYRAISSLGISAAVAATIVVFVKLRQGRE